MSYLPRRGDYGKDTAYHLILVVEAVSCVQGCVMAGSDKDIAEWGPGGTCHLLAKLAEGAEIAEFDAQDNGIYCSARTPQQVTPMTGTSIEEREH